MRKKLTNKEKFQFREEEVLPSLPMKGRNSFQSRLARKADNKMPYNQSQQVRTEQLKHSPHGAAMEGGATPSMGSPDPVLDQIVAKLKSGLALQADKYQAIGQQQAAYSGTLNFNHPTKQFTGPSVKLTNCTAANFTKPVAKITAKENVAASGGCICTRPLKLVMCEVCGETFRARVSLVCSRHPRAIYLQDIKECKGCKQTNIEALKEFDLPLGMEKGKRGIGSNH